MANFFEGIGNLLMHPVNEAKWMFDTTKDVIKGDMSLKDIPGSHQRMMNDITVPLLGDNKLAKNSDAVAGAVVGSVLAAPFVGSAFGGGGSEFATGAFGGGGGGGNKFGNFNPSSFPSFEGGAPSTVPQIKPGDMGWQGGAQMDDFIPSTFDGASEAWGTDDGLPWGDIVKKGLESVVLSEGDFKVSSSAHRPGFRGANIPAMQYNQYAMGDQMATQKWSNVGSQGGTGTEVSKDINQLLGMV